MTRQSRNVMDVKATILLNNETKPDGIVHKLWPKHLHCHYLSLSDVDGEIRGLRVPSYEVIDFLRYVTPEYQAGVGTETSEPMGILRLPKKPRLSVRDQPDIFFDLAEWLDGKTDRNTLYPNNDLRDLFEDLQVPGTTHMPLLDSATVELFYDDVMETLRRISHESSVLEGEPGTAQPSGSILKSFVFHPKDIERITTFMGKYPDSYYSQYSTFSRINDDMNAFIVEIDADSMIVKLLFTLPNIKKDPVGIDVDLTSVERYFQKDGGLVVEFGPVAAWQHLFLKANDPSLLPKNVESVNL